MIAVTLAQQLREAGLVWQPAPLDLFALPDRQMDEDVFVVSDQAAFLQLYNGYPVVAFHGASEWALDYVLLNEVVWMPSETQLRQQIEQRIDPGAPIRLDRTGVGYRCTIAVADAMVEFDGADAESAYARTLLHLLNNDSRPLDDR